MKVVLINAPYPIPKMYGLKRSISTLVYKQLGVGYLAAGLEAQGHTVCYLDCPALGMDVEQITVWLKEEMPDLVGISVFVHGRFLAYDLVKKIKGDLPELPVIVGGPQVSLFPERVFEECEDISLALCGEAECSLALLATKMEQGEALDTVPGIVLRKDNGQLFFGPPPEVIQDIDSILFPARHVYNQELYNPMPITLSLPDMRADQVITSRGCSWGRCRFCYQSNKNMPCYRRRSPENVIAELRTLVDEYGIEFIVFLDDDFLRDEGWIARFCDLYDQEHFTLKWKAIGRVDTATRSMLHRVSKSGCVHVTYGLESGNQETLNLIRKGTTLAQAKDAVRWSHEAGLLVRAYIILGLPAETPEMAEKSLEFVIDLDLDYVTFAPYHVTEGTALEEIALQEGHCIIHDNLNLQQPSYIPKTYENVAHLNKIIRTFYRRFYLRPRYILRAMWAVKNPRLWPSLVSRLWVGLQIIFWSNR